MKTLLIVEDEPLHLEQMKEVLWKHSTSYRLLEADRLSSALDQIKKYQPDIIVTDYQLPDGRGTEILSRMYDQTPVILMSAYGDEQLAVQAIKQGAMDYLVKKREQLGRLPEILERAFREWSLMKEQQRLKEELEDKKKKYKSLFEESNDAVFIHSLEGHILDVNRRGIDLLERTKEQLLASSVLDFHPGETREKGLAMLRKTLEQGSCRFETSIFKASGEKAEVEISARIFDAEKGLVQGILRNITRRKEMEQAMRRSEIFNRAIINNVGEGIAVYDRELRYKVWNPFMEKITGKSASEVLDKRATDVFPFLKEQGLDQLMLEALKGRQVRTPDAPYQVPATGCSGWISGLYTPHYNEQGHVIGLIATIHDITSQKQALEDLRTVNSMKDRLLSIVAHDLKNPMGQIMGFTELLILKSQELSPEKRTLFHQSIYQSTKNLYMLLENLLDWYRLQREEVTLNPRVKDLKKLSEESIQIYQLQADDQEIQLKNGVVDEEMVWTDPIITQTILRNLLSNALKFTNPEGLVEVSSQRSGEKVIVQVKDNGIGMSPEKSHQLFGPAQVSSQQGTRGQKGTGLGLKICKEFIDKMGERIWVESEPGAGTSFFFTLPVALGYRYTHPGNDTVKTA